jgi:starch phosphorylase
VGQSLRFVQEYFLVACSLADLVRRFLRDNDDWRKFPDKVAIQLNDTHPALAVPELMRILLDDAGLGWNEAWDVTQRTLAYTNHTLLPEALERWPLHYFEQILPRQLEIIFEINRRFLEDARRRYPGDDGRTERLSLIEEGPEDKVRMANLAIVGSHSTNGVAAIHSELLRTMTVRDLAEMFPERFNNKTNGVTPRRWLLLANPALAGAITEAIGDGWVTDLDKLSELKPLADEKPFAGRFAPLRVKPSRVSPIGSSRGLARSSTQEPFSTVKSSVYTNTSGSCSMHCASSFSTTACWKIPT